MKVGDPKLAQQISLDNISPKAPTQTKQDSPEAILEVARNFESLFINEIMKNMRNFGFLEKEVEGKKRKEKGGK